MKTGFTILLFFIFSAASGQTSFLKDAVQKFDKALLAKDTVTLKQILHQDLTYGHSNGWVEKKTEVLKNLHNGKIEYKEIKSEDHQYTAGKDWANIRSRARIRYVMDGKPGDLELHVLQVWLKTNKGWQLVARQSTKIQN